MLSARLFSGALLAMALQASIAQAALRACHLPFVRLFAETPRTEASRSRRLALKPLAVIDTVVRGLYDSIPNAPHLAAGPLTLETTARSHDLFVTRLTYHTPDGRSVPGQVARVIDAKRHWMSFEEARLVPAGQTTDRIPPFTQMRGVIDLVPGRGIPTVVFASLHQMRQSGIGFGRLKKASTGEILNERTLRELQAQPEVRAWLSQNPHASYLPEKLIAEHFWATQSGRYIKTILTQSGHRIVRTSAHYGPYDSPHWSLEMELAPLP